MTFSAEAFLALLTMLGAMLTVAVHLLLSINAKVGRIETAHAVSEATVSSDIASIRRHQERNEAETRMMKKHLGMADRN